ncbi:hypothetical protein FXN65_00265 [Metapseudomonas lalkuanensis]|uniref:Lipoprotein n=1 Tax=Metapseudomonas lalkuanensis TaxID=2604832 RepID=A0A5J6QCR8_9GAMM|nr:hypothetical protein [Pseudomonas lalkuanensis]QEY60548.1 hypothetical protein FXN65_00265 [Pseudomonas lalkuanensis]UCO98276.1 hypothetical protein LF844_00195 [Pseudomonas lalkuanensis]
MRMLLALTLLASLCACASKLPEPDPRMAWIDVAPDPSDTLMANRLDDKRWGDGRYYQVMPGKHELELRYQFEAGGGGGGFGMNAEPTIITCYMELHYDQFEAGKRYRVEARNAANQPMAWLYDDQRNVLARHEIFPRCGPF